MARATVYSIVLAPELRDAFLAAAAASERPPAQVLRGLMRDFIQRQQEGDNGDVVSEPTLESADSAATEPMSSDMAGAVAGAGTVVAGLAAAVTDEANPATERPGATEAAGEATAA